MTKIAIAGCAGRMGRELLAATLDDGKAILAGGLVSAGHAALGKDVATLVGREPVNVTATSDIQAFVETADVVIDFTTPELTLALAQACNAAGVALVTGTTGLTAQQQASLEQAATNIALLQSFNMSVGVNLLAQLVEQAAAKLDDRFDIEILEMHHKHKVDAPSGTALMLGQAAASGRGVALADVKETVRDGHTGARKQGDIGFAVLRGGGVIGEHRVMLVNEHERIELAHISQSRAIYAGGAVMAAHWLASQPAGLYSMREMLT